MQNKPKLPSSWFNIGDSLEKQITAEQTYYMHKYIPILDISFVPITRRVRRKKCSSVLNHFLTFYVTI